MRADLAIVGGTVVSSAGSRRVDLVVRDGHVADLPVAGGDIEAATVIDAGDLLVMPGMVDTHVHLMEPGPTEREDFPTGTAAAAARGVTTIIEHTHAHPVRDPGELADKRAALRGRSNVSFGLAAHVWPDRIESLQDTWRAGVSFFKVFTCATHGVPAVEGDELRRTFRAVAGFGGTCLVHAEDETQDSGCRAYVARAGARRTRGSSPSGVPARPSSRPCARLPSSRWRQARGSRSHTSPAPRSRR